MKHKLVALTVVFAIMLALVIPVSADGARDTDFFRDRTHADVDFADMKYEAADVEAALAQMDAVRTLAADAANAAEVRSGFLAAQETVTLAYTMYCLTYIYTSLDVTDERAEAEYEEAYSDILTLSDAFYALARDILLSPCAAALDGVIPDGDSADLLEYEDMTAEEKARGEQETALENEFWQLAAQTYTAEYGGAPWDDDLALTAYYSGLIGYEDYVQIVRAIAKNKNAVLGELYLRMVALREEIAAAEGYDDYSEYAYENVYQRDYTPADMEPFHAAVKEYIVPVYNALVELYYAENYRDVFYTDYTGDTALDLMQPYVAALSDELLESFAYMRAHGLYDSGYSAVKNEQGYTIDLPYYGAAFFFNAPSYSFYDMSTAIHEFGHYNNAYWTQPGWDLDDKSIDIAEVHSQGLELLFTEFYPSMFGDDAEAARSYVMLSLMSAIVTGALYDELQQYVYATDNVTLRQINEKYCQLMREYGQIDADDPRTEMYGWVDVHHTFASPCYYISYAVSAAGAFAFWLNAQKDYYAAVDDYLRFTALDITYDFQDSFRAVGMSSPITADYLKELAAAVWAALDMDAALGSLPVVGYFRDVRADDWFLDAVDFVYYSGLMDGITYASFAPAQTMTRAQLVTILWRFALEPDSDYEMAYTDVADGAWYTEAVRWATEAGITDGTDDALFGTSVPVTREQAVTMLWRFAQYIEADVSAGEDTNILSYDDVFELDAYAWSAMQWACGAGVIEGVTDTTLVPKGELTRAYVAQILLNLYNVLMAE